MARLRKTSVYLTQREYAGLRRAARLTGRTQSDLIREGVRKVAFSVSSPPPTTEPPESDPALLVPTRRESFVIGLDNANWTPAAIARDQRMTEAEVRAILDRFRREDRGVR